ncbi:hypothetical protein RZS28_13975 [Methylocapsa polymorpha]|uniref:Uncharacterized protein n=1 Tax=Methylocapsa polymorpha TaxID=3080828 RepID=A0ABZ0HQI5_9HYPH|nr:hypothetical protein RZS28_13975 [Methylocapsa sp. RX1]
MIVIFGVVGALGLIAMGARQLIGAVTIKTIPIVGEWQAAGKPWRIVFRPDKTIASFSGPAQPGASGGGVYSIDYFGTLWVKMDDGRTYTATLMAETPNRIDLIDSSSEGVTVLERAPPAPNPLDSPANLRN